MKLVFVQKITSVLRKINRNCCHRSCTFDSNIDRRRDERRWRREEGRGEEMYA